MNAIRLASALATLFACTLLLLLGCDTQVLAPRSAAIGKLRPGTTIRGLAGRHNVLAAATDRGIAVFELPAGTARFDARDAGLPSPDVRAVAIDARLEEMAAATSAGLARGGLSDPWSAALDTPPVAFEACIARPGGGWIAGGRDGLLVAWAHDRIDSLRIPRRNARIVDLAFAPAILDPSLPSDLRHAPGPEISIAPGFFPGLVVATESDGLWILRAAGLLQRWLQLAECDGLRGSRLHAVATDAAGRLWIATDAGIGCLERGVTVQSWPEVVWLSQPIRALFAHPDGSVYAGCATGLFRITLARTREAGAPNVERLAVGRVTALAWADGTLWWTDGFEVQSLNGRRLETGPHSIPPVICPIWLASRCATPAFEPGTAVVTPGVAARTARLRQFGFGFGRESSTRAAPGGGAFVRSS